jgi:hypothetical protein
MKWTRQTLARRAQPTQDDGTPFSRDANKKPAANATGFISMQCSHGRSSDHAFAVYLPRPTRLNRLSLIKAWFTIVRKFGLVVR